MAFRRLNVYASAQRDRITARIQRRMSTTTRHHWAAQAGNARIRKLFQEQLESRVVLAGDAAFHFLSAANSLSQTEALLPPAPPRIASITGSPGNESIVVFINPDTQTIEAYNGPEFLGSVLLSITDVLQVDLLGGDDTLNVIDRDQLLDSHSIAINVDVGDGNNTVVMTDTPASFDEYTPLQTVANQLADLGTIVGNLEQITLGTLQGNARDVINSARTQLADIASALSTEVDNTIYPKLDDLQVKSDSEIFSPFDTVIAQVNELADRTEKFVEGVSNSVADMQLPTDPEEMDPNDDGSSEVAFGDAILAQSNGFAQSAETIGTQGELDFNAAAGRIESAATAVQLSAEDVARRANELETQADTLFGTTESALNDTQSTLLTQVAKVRDLLTQAASLFAPITAKLQSPANKAANVPGGGGTAGCQITVKHTFNGGSGTDIFFPFSAPSASWQINGGGGADILFGGFAADEINGGAGSDFIFGLKGNDLIHGDAGIDFLFGEFLIDLPSLTGDDCMYGDADIDLVVGDNAIGSATGTPGGNDDMHGGDDIDLLVGDDITDIFSQPLPGGNDTMYGDKDFDALLGTGGNDTIYGGLYVDVLFGNAGLDTLYANDATFTGDGYTIPSTTIVLGSIEFGNQDNDTIYGADGLDLQFGNGAQDTIYGKDYVDVQFGMDDQDTMYGESGGVLFTISSIPVRFGNLMFGGPEKDTMWGGGDLDVMFGNADNDTMHGYDGNFVLLGIDADVMFGGTGNDDMEGDAEQIVLLTSNDVMFGQDGQDTMRGGSQSDLMFGGPGIDTMSGDSNGVTLINSRDLMFGGADNDIMDGGNSSDLMFGNDGNDTMTGDNEAVFLITSTDLMFGNDGNDTMNGGSQPDIVFGNAGNDTINGDGNNLWQPLSMDILFGNSGNDNMDGGNGKDLMFGNEGDDTMKGDASVLGMVTSQDLMFGNDGDDWMDGGVNQDLMFGNNDCDIMQGDNNAGWIGSIDTMFGNDGCDTMAGGSSIDFMFGNAGIDTMNGQDGLDTMSGGDGTDVISGGDFADILLGNNDGDVIHGDNGIDLISGNDGDDCLYGDSHTDFIWGGSGNDCIHGGNAADFLYGQNDNDNVFGESGGDGIHGGDGNDNLDGADGVDRLWGNNNDDQLWGGLGKDFLYGGSGNDSLWGGSNFDILIGGGGSDSLTQGGPDSSGIVCSCVIQPCKFDFGDAPASYGTLLIGNGARHGLQGPRLGVFVDREPDGQPTALADGDDLNNDDEDGVTLSTLFTGLTTSITVQVTNAASAKLDAWVDFNANGVFDAAEKVINNVTVVAGSNSVSIATPVAAVIGQRVARFRLSTAGGLGPIGQAFDGEVEDYLVQVSRPNFDFGDAPDSYKTTSGVNGPSHDLGGPRLGILEDAEPNGQPTVGANGDDLNTSDDEDGAIFNWLVPGFSTAVTVTLSNAAAAKLDGWVDFNGNGTFDPAEKIFNSVTIVAGANLLSFPVPSTSVLNTYARLRVSPNGGLTPVGYGGFGEVEDYHINGEVNIFDMGDAPDSYKTFFGSGGPTHAIGGPQLGALIDFDGNGQPTPNADGDDVNFTDDEDGVTLTGLVPGSNGTASIVLANAPTAKLDAWMDFNGNGNFDPFEQIFSSAPLVAGNNTLSFAIPVNTVISTYARFRVSVAGGLGPAGPGGLGEVEDYAVHMQPGNKPGADLNGDGSVDAADAGVLFASWGGSDASADLNQDGIIDAADAGELFAAWSGDSLGRLSTPTSSRTPTLASGTPSHRRVLLWSHRIDAVFAQHRRDRRG